MDSSQNRNWMSILDENLLDNYEWCSQAVLPLESQNLLLPEYSVECSKRDSDDFDKLGSQKRIRDEVSSGVSKACREKIRRDKLNDKFMELSATLEPGKPLKTDKSTILSEAIRMLSQLRIETQHLKETNYQLLETVKELKAEKYELREEKLRLKTEMERLEQQIKVPVGYIHPSAAVQVAAAFLAQSQAAANKTAAAYPGIPMWQWMPASALDTSQDHLLRPPAA